MLADYSSKVPHVPQQGDPLPKCWGPAEPRTGHVLGYPPPARRGVSAFGALLPAACAGETGWSGTPVGSVPGLSWAQGAGLRACREVGAQGTWDGGEPPGLTARPRGGRGRGGAGARCPWGCRGRRGGDRGWRTALPAAHLGLGPVLQKVLQVEVGERRPHAAGAGAAPRLEGHPAAPPPLHRRRQQLQPVPLAPTERPGPGSAPRPRRRLQLRRGLDRTLRPCGRERRRAGGRCGAGRSWGRAGGGSAGSAAATCCVPAGPPVVSVSVASSRRLAMPG